jgi:hypothetical protein
LKIFENRFVKILSKTAKLKIFEGPSGGWGGLTLALDPAHARPHQKLNKTE